MIFILDASLQRYVAGIPLSPSVVAPDINQKVKSPAEKSSAISFRELAKIGRAVRTSDTNGIRIVRCLREFQFCLRRTYKDIGITLLANFGWAKYLM